MTMPPRCLACWLAAAAAITAGCGGADRASESAPGGYPLVRETAAAHQPPVTTPGGAVVRRPVKPSAHTAVPSQACERVMATFHDGRRPFRRPIVIPPRPGLRAVAVSQREVEVEWSFRSLPEACRPAAVVVSVIANDDVRATPTNREVAVTARTGTTRIAYPDFLSAPDVAMASAVMRNGRSSRTARVLISR
jgi:hypothetical protein